MKKITSWINSRISFLVCALTLFCCLSAFTAQANAADFTVNLTIDEHDANTADGVCDTDLATAGEQCSLRAAVEQANAFSGNDRILFNLPSDSTIILTMTNGGEMSLEDGLEIVGTGADNLTINGGSFNRIFFTLNSAVTISGVTLTGGSAMGLGGAIFTIAGSLALEGVHITGNSASDLGGGVVFFSGAHRIINSTFSGNNANDCGGFFNLDGTVSIANSTISDNTAANFGGGFCSSGGMEATTLRNVTITDNTAGSGGGGIYAVGLLNLGNTIVAGNNATGDIGPEILFDGGEITSAGGNLIGDSAGDSNNTGIPVLFQSSDILDTNPLLGSLTNNGTTPTHALLPNSPAIDKGADALATDLSDTNAPLAFDQRGAGFPRLSGASVDIGAFEVQQTSSITPEEMIEDLKELIQSYNPRLHHGIEKSLLAKLNSALEALAEGNTEEAKDSLQSFINHVRAQKGKKITAAQAEELIEAAEEILEALE